MPVPSTWSPGAVHEGHKQRAMFGCFCAFLNYFLQLFK